MGFLDPETLFSRKWGFGALSGVGGIATRVALSSSQCVLQTPLQIADLEDRNLLK